MDSSSKKTELKRLILKGKEQGFLTYREINDHLPEDMNDTDQIESVVNMINDWALKFLTVCLMQILYYLNLKQIKKQKMMMTTPMRF